MNNSQNVEFINEKNKKNSASVPFNIGFIKNKKIFFIISTCIFLVGMVCFIVLGFNWDIDFIGGTVLHYRINQTIDVNEQGKIDNIVKGIIGDDTFSYSTIAGSAKDEIIIKSKEIDTDKRNAVFNALASEYNLNNEDIFTAENVNPTVGKDLAKDTIFAVVSAIVLMLIYITIRFDFFSGAATIICLIHDIFVTLIFYSILQIPMDASVIAAFLTILAYSINATIIIFDRVRENKKLDREKQPFSTIVNNSLNQTLLRSFNTTITTLFTIGMIYILGVSSIRQFVFPLIIGITAGLYSSLCLSGALWIVFTKNKKATEKEQNSKA